MIIYRESCESIETWQLTGFFVGWSDPPSPETHLELLRKSDIVVLAIETPTQQVVGFITAISDGVLSAYIPFLEVLPEYQSRGIGTELLHRALAKVNRLYMVDLVCDEELTGFYQRLGMEHARAMVVRNYARQSGR